MILGWIDLLGYAASGLTLATFAQQAMLRMRVLAIGANLCFIGYGAMGQFMPVLALHLVLLPINLLRLRTLLGPSACPADRRSAEAADASATIGFSSGLL
jgi:hypothetical protein